MGQQLSILDSCPAHLPSDLNVVTDDVTCQAPIDALIEKNLGDSCIYTT
jgi:hypothetical protein